MRRVEPDDGWQRPERSIPTQEEREAHAYLLLEEARLRCERFENGPLQSELRLIHREIGMAGLFASSEIPSSLRHALLDAARLYDESPIPGDPVAVLEVALGRACTAVERCLTARAPADHMHLAHVHALGAIDVLNGWLSESTPPQIRGGVD
jgi:hypothetical protein